MLKKKERGVAIMIVLVALLFLMGVGLAFIFWVMSATKQTTQKKLATSDVFHAEIGVEQAVKTVQDNQNDWGTMFTDSITTDVVNYTYTMDDGSTITVKIEDVP